MASAPTFRELAHALPEDERRDLYRRIMASLGLANEDEQKQRLVRTEIRAEQRKEIVSREIAALGFFGRVRLWLRAWVTGKMREDAFVDQKLIALRKKLVKTGVCASANAPDTVSEAFAERLYGLFRAAWAVAPLFSDLWQARELLRNVMQGVMDRRVPNSRSVLGDFITDEEMKNIYVVSRSKSDIRNHLLERLDHYVGGIHESVFAEILTGMTPLYYLKSLALFDYVGLLSNFGYAHGDPAPGTTPAFSRARAVILLESLEELYYAFHVWQRQEGKFNVHRELLEFYLQTRTASISDDPMTPDEMNRNVGALERDIHGLYDAAASFAAKVPLAEMIKFYRNDPYFRFVAYTPRIDLKDFYYNALRVVLLGEIDERFPVVRESAINTLIEETFGHHPPDFSHFRTGGTSSVGKSGLPTFRHVRSLNIVYNFVQIIYRRVVRPTLPVIHRSMPGRSRDLSNELSFYSAGLEDLADKINSFDESFSPDSEEGKTFYRVRYAMDKDSTQQRIYRSIVAQRDKQSRGLVDKALEYLNGIQAVLRKLQGSNAGHRAGQDASVAVDTMTERYVGSLERIIQLVNLILAAEEMP